MPRQRRPPRQGQLCRRKRKLAICRDATGTNTMTESLTVDGPSPANGAVTVSASALAHHLDCSRAYIGKLEAEGVIRRQSDGFPLDKAALRTCDTCGARDGNRHAVRQTLITSGPRPRCCNFG